MTCPEFTPAQGCGTSETAAVEGAHPTEAQERGGQEAGFPGQSQGLRRTQRCAAEHSAQAAAPVQPVRLGHQLC